MEEKTIMYIDYPWAGWEDVSETYKEMGKPWKWLSYFDALRDGDLKTNQPRDVNQEDILAVVEKRSLDLLTMDGGVAYNLRIPPGLKERGLRVKTLISPIYLLYPGMKSEDCLKASGADFGLDRIDLYETMAALDAIFAGRTGGYVFNPNFYENRNGLLVPKGQKQ